MNGSRAAPRPLGPRRCRPAAAASWARCGSPAGWTSRALRAWASPGSPRVLPRGVVYEGRIHEQPASDLPRRRLALSLGHDGYTTENLARKGERNETLLMRELQARRRTPTSGSSSPRSTRPAGAPRRRRSASPRPCASRPPTPAIAMPWWCAPSWRLKANGQLADALALADAEVATGRPRPTSISWSATSIWRRRAEEPDRAMDHFLPVAESAWKRCLEIGERPELDGAVAGRGGLMAAHNLAVFYETLGDRQKAAEYAALAQRLRG